MVIQGKEGVNISMKIGKLIEKERIKNNISKAKLAEKVGCTSRSIDYWENGERSISLENADKIFKALGTTITIGNGSKFTEKEVIDEIINAHIEEKL